MCKQITVKRSPKPTNSASQKKKKTPYQAVFFSPPSTLSPDATISSLSIEQHSTELHSLPRCLGVCLLGLRTQLRQLLLTVRVLVTGDLNERWQMSGIRGYIRICLPTYSVVIYPTAASCRLHKQISDYRTAIMCECYETSYGWAKRARALS